MSQLGMHRFEWPDDPTVEFHLSHGDWIRLLRAYHFEIEDLIELWPEPDAGPSCGFVTAQWAQVGPAKRYGAPDDSDPHQ